MDNCLHSTEIALLTQRDVIIMEEISEIKKDIKAILAALDVARIVQIEQVYHKESMSRLFTRLECVELEQKEVSGRFQRLEGVKAVALFLWAILSSGIGVLVLKSFGVF